jgi:hypothetical protein
LFATVDIKTMTLFDYKLMFDFLEKNQGKHSMTKGENEAQEAVSSMHTVLDVVTQQVEQGQVMIGAMAGGVNIMKPPEKTATGSTPSPAVANTVQNKGPNKVETPTLTASKLRSKQKWKTQKMKDRKELLTKLLVSASCIFVMMFCMTMLMVVSWWSLTATVVATPWDSRTAAQLPPPGTNATHHTILF